MDYNKEYKSCLTLAEKALENAFTLFSDAAEPLLSSMKYSVSAGGKRLRPVLLLSACKLCGGNTENALPFAAAIELIHTYSLIHDDLPCMDNDDFRRGKPTNHKVFGEGMAVLAGDGLLNMAYEIMLRHILSHNTAYNINAAQEIASAAGSLGMVSGQCADLYYGNNISGGEKELLYIHKNKTGKMIEAAATSGAYAANADESTVEILRKFSCELGILFQITDDILDITGDASKLGKSTGKDEKSNKLTYPKIYGLEKSAALAKARYENILNLLSPFGGSAEFLCELSLKMLNRDK